MPAAPVAPPPVTRTITLAEGMTVKDLADKLDVRVKDVLARLFTKRMIMTINSTVDVETAKDLACLARLPADAINYKIQNQFTAPVILTQPGSQATWGRRRVELMAELKDKVFRWFPTGPITFETKVSKNTGGWMVRYGYTTYKASSFQSEEGVRIRAQLFAPTNRASATPLLIYVRRTVDSFYSSDVDELLPLMGRYTVLMLNPRLTEQSMSPAEYTDVERTAVWTGRTIGAMQVWDILRAIQWVTDEEKLSASSISLYGKGEMGILALYAALFDERVKQVILNEPPASHWQGPALLNVLRLTDIPEVAGAFAPRRLISVSKLPETFDYTKRIYKLERASSQFVQSGVCPRRWKCGGNRMTRRRPAHERKTLSGQV
jgi:hypothetical protein